MLIKQKIYNFKNAYNLFTEVFEFEGIRWPIFYVDGSQAPNEKVSK